MGAKEIIISPWPHTEERQRIPIISLRYEVNKDIRAVLKAYRPLIFVFGGMNARYGL
jgi:hypothetical protein